MKRRHWLAVLVILLAACGDDDGDSPPPGSDASSDARADNAGRGGSAGAATGGSGGSVDAAADTGRGGTAGSGGGGASGTGGTAGSGGVAGTGGASGTGGTAGTSGAAGAGGAAGTGGTAGASGAAGGGGASGSTDSGATGGNAGTSGVGGTSGAAGAGGAAGTGGSDADASIDDAADGDASVDDAADGDTSVDDAADGTVDQGGADTSSDAPSNDGASCPICVAGATCEADGGVDGGVCICPSSSTGDGTTTGTGCKPKPELLWYRFDGTGTSVPNLAISPPAGTATATIMGGLSQGGTGQCGGAIIGSGVTSTTDYVNTGWATSLSGTSWTISFWTADVTPSTTLFYIFGDQSASSFRCFTNGIAGPSNWILRGGGLTDVPVTGGATVAPSFTTFVYDSVAGQVRAYLNGVLVNTVAQGTPTITGTGPFKVIGWSDRVGMANGGKLDEFRVYNRALSPTEIADLAAPICP